MKLAAKEWGLFAVPIVLLSVCYLLSAPPDQLDARLRKLAGVHATDCGTGDMTQNSSLTDKVRDCSLQALHQHQPFYMHCPLDQTALLRNDNDGAVGLVGTSQGKVLLVTCHSLRVFGVTRRQEMSVGSASDDIASRVLYPNMQRW